MTPRDSTRLGGTWGEGGPSKLLSYKDATTYYHVVWRCMRRAWLWGFDEYAGRDYSHRKECVLERLWELSGAFAIDGPLSLPLDVD